MKIIELELCRYNRFKLSKIERFIYKPKNYLQLILGTNGSGKSSLLEELTPLPSNLKANFLEGGYKRIVIEYKNNNYELISGVNGKNKYSFKVNGEELNSGGTKKVYLHLVKEHFNITPEIHRIMIDKSRFTNLSPLDRKNLLIKISNIDFDYALNIFDKLRSRSRDLKGALNIQNSKIEVDKENIITKNMIDEYKKELKLVNEIIEELIKFINRENEEKIPNLNKIENIKSSIENKLLNVKYTKNQLLAKKDDLIDLVNKLKVRKEHIVNELSKFHKLDNKEIDTIENKENEKRVLEKKIDKIKNSISYIDNIDTAKVALNRYDNIKGFLFSLTDKNNLDISNEYLLKLKNIYNELTIKKDKINELLDNIKHKIMHLEELKNNKDVVCPNCNYKFKHGFSINDYNTLLNKEYEFKKSLKILENKLQNIVEQIEFIEELNKNKENLKTILNNDKLINIFIKPIENRIPNISNLLDMLRDIVYEAESLIELDKLNIKLEKVNNYIKWANEISLEDIIKNKNMLEKDLINIDKEYNIRLKELNLVNNLLKKVNEIENDKELLEKEILKINKFINNYDKLLVKDFAKSILKELRLHRDKLTDTIHKSELSLNKLESLKKEIDELTNRKRTLDNIITALSPNKGLISKLIFSFIEELVKEINKVISYIWSYDFEIGACEIENNDLNFKFPIYINGKREADDIVDGSSSMQDVVNLAFKIVMMHLLGISDYPIYLDEFGRTMDKEHREKAFEMVNSNIFSSFSQIFIISHFEEFYSRFLNYDAIVISDTNLDLNRLNNINDVLEIK